MRTDRRKTYQVTLDDTTRAQLESYARSRSLPQALARRSKIILLATMGLTNTAVAEQLGVSNPTIADWCRRFIEHGLAGLYDLPGNGPHRTFEDEEVVVIKLDDLSKPTIDGLSRGALRDAVTKNISLERALKINCQD